ncbi:MAG: HAD family hydrolase [Acidobacteria bacterium]|nr:HAD family hydrolase [Acidobacteriota bacterium]
MVKPGVIVFDMDGVLVDVRQSYRAAIMACVSHFTARDVTHEDIQGYKNRGGYNNDWLLSQHMARDLGVEVPYDEVVRVFNQLFLGTYFARERWLPEPGLLDRLSARAALYVFTGRMNEEAMMTLRRFSAVPYFTGVLGDDNVARPKPAPDGLVDIQARHPGAQLVYLGDTVDDANASRGAGVPFVGVGAEAELLRATGAYATIANINELEQWIA